MSIDPLFSEQISENDEFSWQIHSCSKNTLSIFKMIFPDLKKMMTVNPSLIDQLNVIVIFQKTKNSMDGFSDLVEDERIKKTEQFIEWSKSIVDEFGKLNQWCDIIDPSSGLPFYGSRGTTLFIETDDFIMKLGYEILDFGCCKAIYHKKWGTFAFLSVLFTLAPAEKVFEIMKSHPFQ